MWKTIKEQLKTKVVAWLEKLIAKIKNLNQ